MRARPLAAIVAAAVALPAAAYLPPATAILKRAAQRREEVGPPSMQVQGTFTLLGPAAQLARTRSLPLAPDGGAPATFFLKSPGRCQLELAPDGVSPADRPSVGVRAGRISGRRGLDGIPAGAALVQATCVLLA